MTESSVLIVGSIALDTIHTRFGTHTSVVGGAATYGALSCVKFAKPRLVAITGSDFPQEVIHRFDEQGVCIQGLQQVPEKTFHWEGRYNDTFSSRDTLVTELNAFANFRPTLPDGYRDTPYLLLGNIGPDLQLSVLDQLNDPKLVVTDTMNYWIESAVDDLKRVLERTTILVLNDEEARQLSGEHNLSVAAEHLLRMGPTVVVIKKGEYGSTMHTADECFSIPALPVRDLRDPTGAGDTFAGGFLGYLAREGKHDFDNIKRAMVYGTVNASACVRSVGTAGLIELSHDEIQHHALNLHRMTTFELTH